MKRNEINEKFRNHVDETTEMLNSIYDSTLLKGIDAYVFKESFDNADIPPNTKRYLLNLIKLYFGNNPNVFNRFKKMIDDNLFTSSYFSCANPNEDYHFRGSYKPYVAKVFLGMNIEKLESIFGTKQLKIFYKGEQYPYH